MRRKIVLAITIIVCFLLQCTVFKALAIASISPNLLIVVVASFGFMRGKKEGLFVGFFAGLLLVLVPGQIFLWLLSVSYDIAGTGIYNDRVRFIIFHFTESQ